MRVLWELFISFFKVGIFTIGGGVAMLPVVQDTVVYKKKWMTEREMIDCFAVAQSIPGGVIINTATYVGRKQKGFLGSAAAALGVTLPSFLCIILFVSVLSIVGDNRYISGFFEGALSAAAGLVAVSLVKMAKTIYNDPIDLVVIGVAFILVIFLKVSIVWVILGSIPLGFIVYTVRRNVYKRKGGGYE